MPRPARNDGAEIVRILRRYRDDIITSNNEIVKPSNPIWERISKQLDGRISSKYAYTLVKTNRFESWTALNIRRTNEVNNEENLENSTLEDLSDDGNTSETCRNFSIHLSQLEWQKLIQISNYRRGDLQSATSREYKILQPFEWTSKIHVKFVECTQLPCCITYKRAKILPEGAYFLKIYGQCKTCSSKFEGTMFQNPLDPSFDDTLPILLECKYMGDFKNCLGRKKRQLIGSQQQLLRRQLVDEKKTAASIRQNLAREMMVYGDREPSNLPSANQLRILKCRTKKQSRLDNDPINAIRKLKGEEPYNTVIGDTGADRFFVHYWTATQVNSYREYARKISHPKILIDATGSVVKKVIHLSGKKSAAIFLYQITVNDPAKQSQFNTGQMLSERHDADSISHWLKAWLRSKIPAPKIIVTDQSMALMIAVVMSFTQYSSLWEYLRVCSLLLKKKENVSIPSAMLRNDINHVICLISRWDVFKNQLPRFKPFYMKSICLIIQNKDYDDVLVLLKYIFTCATHEAEGDNSNNTPTACKVAKLYLKNRISQTPELNLELEENEEIIDDPDSPKNDMEFELEMGSENTSIWDDIKAVYSNVTKDASKRCNQGDVDNAHFCPKVASQLLAFCKLLPLWSGIMVPIFGYGNEVESSASVENSFNQLKNIVMKHFELPVRVDIFIERHINSILGEMILVRAKEGQGQKKTVKRVASKDEEEMDYEENWRGQNEKKKKKKKGSYLDPDPTMRLIDDSRKKKRQPIGVLKNGSLDDLRCIVIDDQRYQFINTCPFDCIVQILSCVYADSPLYSNFIETNIDQCKLFGIVVGLVRHGIDRNIYKLRGQILKEFFVSRIENGINVCDAQTTVGHFYKQLMNHYPTVNEELICSKCTYKQNRTRVVIVANITGNKKMSDIEDILNGRESRNICDICKSTSVIAKKTYSPLLLVEVASDCRAQGYDVCTTLHAIPTRINVDGTDYFVRGAVEFKPPIMSCGTGHYIAYVYRQLIEKWEVYNDMRPKKSLAALSVELEHCQFLFYST